jgi:hypothetical protein
MGWDEMVRCKKTDDRDLCDGNVEGMFNFTRDAFGSHLLTYSPTLKVDKKKNLNTTINLITLITIN